GRHARSAASGPLRQRAGRGAGASAAAALGAAGRAPARRLPVRRTRPARVRGVPARPAGLRRAAVVLRVGRPGARHLGRAGQLRRGLHRPRPAGAVPPRARPRRVLQPAAGRPRTVPRRAHDPDGGAGRGLLPHGGVPPAGHRAHRRGGRLAPDLRAGRPAQRRAAGRRARRVRPRLARRPRLGARRDRPGRDLGRHRPVHGAVPRRTVQGQPGAVRGGPARRGGGAAGVPGDQPARRPRRARGGADPHARGGTAHLRPRLRDDQRGTRRRLARAVLRGLRPRDPGGRRRHRHHRGARPHRGDPARHLARQPGRRRPRRARTGM
ncbi:MAG: Various polyols ABC transporter, permease protein 1, partial [uncultured Nocardioidaceae bacterium]